MGALKPRGADGPLEVELGREGCTVLIPVDGGGRLVVALGPDEAALLGQMLTVARA